MDLQDLDRYVEEYRNHRRVYEECKKICSDAHSAYKEAEMKLMDILTEQQKTKYFVDGVGTVTLVDKFSVPTPKDTASKKEFFTFLRKEGGEELLYAYATVNSMALNKFYNDMKEEHGMGFEIPGLEAPVLSQQLRFRNDK